MSLTRLLQVRDVILNRQSEAQRDRLRIEETEVRALMVAIHAAANNKRGVRAAQRWRLFKEAAKPLDMQQALASFPVGPEGLITREMIEARKAELGMTSA